MNTKKTAQRPFKKRIPKLACITAAVLSTLPALAAEVTWSGTTDSNFSTLTNWSLGTVPNAADNAFLNVLANAPVIVGAGDNFTLGFLGIGNSNSTATSGALTIQNGGVLNVPDATNSTVFVVGGGGVSGNSGTVRIESGGQLFTGPTSFGRGASPSSASMTVTGAGSLWRLSSTGLTVGQLGNTAQLNIFDGGRVSLLNAGSSISFNEGGGCIFRARGLSWRSRVSWRFLAHHPYPTRP